MPKKGERLLALEPWLKPVVHFLPGNLLQGLHCDRCEMKIHDDYGVRTTLGIGLGIFAFIVATISTVFLVPATGWALFAPIGCEVACTSNERYWIVLVMICPIMLGAAAALGFRAAFGQLSASTIGLSLSALVCAAFIIAVDLGYVS